MSPDTIDDLSPSNESFPASSSEEVDEQMNGYKRYIMEGSGGNVLNRHVKTRKTKIFSNSMQELDDTVVSIGKQQYRSPRRPGGEDDSVSSQSIATHASHSIHTHRNLIDNMQEIDPSDRLYSPAYFETPSACTGRSSRVSRRSACTGRSSRVSRRSACTGRSSRVSRRSGRSQGTRRKRGLSLEREISKTILESAAWGGTHFMATPEDKSALHRLASTEFILQDLDLANSIIQSETSSTRSNDTSALHMGKDTSPVFDRRSNLLPPMFSKATDDESETFITRDDTTDAVVKSFPDLTTPDTSDESSLEHESPDEFFELGGDSFPSVTWPSRGGNDNSTRTSRKEKLSRSTKTSEQEEWTTFDKNPFMGAWPSDDDIHDNLELLSIESPSSIANFDAGCNQLRSKSSDYWNDKDSVSESRFSV
jgi:hypothetical protein